MGEFEEGMTVLGSDFSCVLRADNAPPSLSEWCILQSDSAGHVDFWYRDLEPSPFSFKIHRRLSSLDCMAYVEKEASEGAGWIMDVPTFEGYTGGYGVILHCPLCGSDNVDHHNLHSQPTYLWPSTMLEWNEEVWIHPSLILVGATYARCIDLVWAKFGPSMEGCGYV